MHELLVSFLIISLTMFPLYSEKVKRLALKERNQYVARVYWMQKLKQILQWQPCMGGGLDFFLFFFFKVLVSQISTGNTNVSLLPSFWLMSLFWYWRDLCFSWRWLVVYTAVSLSKRLIYLFVCVCSLQTGCTNELQKRQYHALGKAVHVLMACCSVLLSWAVQNNQCFALSRWH